MTKAEQMVEENFKGLADYIKDPDMLQWFKDLIVTCMEEYASQPTGQIKQIGEWQLCPKCYGEGIVPTSGTSVTKQCDVCNGNKIIQKPIINQTP